MQQNPPTYIPTTASPNDATLAAYNHDVSGYINNTPQDYGKEHQTLLLWIDMALSLLPKHEMILEIGSGTGRDATYIEEKGYKIMRSDGARSFVKLLQENGNTALDFNVLYDSIPKGYSMVFANAVFPHFTEVECKYIFKKIYDYLPKYGLFVFNAKQGKGYVWTEEKLKEKRYIHYWQPGELVDLLKEIGFEVAYFNHDTPGDLTSHTWTHLVLRKLKA
jgi:SAM-dependent methyltransferase